MAHEVEKLGLNKNIKIIEYTNNIYKYMKASKSFILSSLLGGSWFCNCRSCTV